MRDPTLRPDRRESDSKRSVKQLCRNFIEIGADGADDRNQRDRQSSFAANQRSRKGSSNKGVCDRYSHYSANQLVKRFYATYVYRAMRVIE